MAGIHDAEANANWTTCLRVYQNNIPSKIAGDLLCGDTAAPNPSTGSQQKEIPSNGNFSVAPSCGVRGEPSHVSKSHPGKYGRGLSKCHLLPNK